MGLGRWDSGMSDFPLCEIAKSVAEVPMRDKVKALEAEMLKMPQVEMPAVHYFSQGVYAREITIPKGTVLTGKIHKYQQLNIMSKGDMSVLTEEGIKRVKAPFAIVSPAGTKRIAFAHEESVWTTIHGTEENDLEKIEQHFIAQNDAEYLEFQALLLENKSCLG